MPDMLLPLHGRNMGLRDSGSRSSVSSYITAQPGTINEDNNGKPPQEGSMQIKQPQTHEITDEQLIKEVCGIYTALVKVEKKCIEMDKQ